MNLSKDSYGITFSTDLLLVVFLLILVLGIVANTIDSSNEKIINPLEVAELERITNEVVDSLINNPGTPSHWEELINFNGVNPGLAIENSANKTIINTISFKKIKILDNGEYNNLIQNKIFNNRIKSSITIYPIDSNINPMIIGEDISSLNNISNIVVVNRTVKCDFYRELAIVSIFNSNLNSYNENICNHETLTNLNHSDSENYVWICEEFKITKKDLENNDYYLFFSNDSINNGNNWILDSIKDISMIENSINNDRIILNDNFNNILENKSSMICYIHFRANKNKLTNFNVFLVGIPKDRNVDELNIDYFKEQDCYFVMKSSYN
ncbi:hypothetical protein KQY27_02820 [Methanobrevibacter sp. TMH8]|uniref:hypothetical protein n=1 Tax=Methanobrevibacter sp. TMH8 TaxID=2848611 RepID=UPI001CCF230F|nr:hypothetical protein [Methanobrevibacter sp. TMH8]MBZ9570477.1 hypothetical protein [Methanobrevibacter sp. TMH8]